MEKRFFVALGLSLLIILAWNMMFAPPEPPPRSPQTPTEETTAPAEIDRAAEPVPPAGEVDSPPGGDGSAPSWDARAATAEREVVVENDLVRVTFTNRGARIVSWQLKEYLDPEGDPLELIPCFREEDAPLPWRLDLDDEALAAEINRSSLFEVERGTAPSIDERGPGETVTFRWADGQGLEVVKSLTVRGSYIVDTSVDVFDRGRRRPARIALGPGFQARGSGAGGRVSSYYNYPAQVVWLAGGVVERQRRGKVEDRTFRADMEWVGLEDQYFAALVVPDGGETEVRMTTRAVTTCTAEEGGDHEEAEEADEVVVGVSVPASGTRMFIGPKKYTMLTGIGHDLDRVVWFSSYPLLAWIARGLFLSLLWIHDHIVGNYGLAILLATMALRIVLFPLNQWSMVRMKKAQQDMSRVQPQMNALKKKYQKRKDAQSRAQMNQEMMELYRREGISPMGGIFGCLPLLAQFPILIGFYNMLTVAIELRGAPFFGWIQDLSRQDPYYVLPLLMGVTMFYQQRLAQTKVTDPVQKQQQKIMMFMPIMFTYICIQMPSGMVLYWFANNLLGIGQQWLVNRHTDKLLAADGKA